MVMVQVTLQLSLHYVDEQLREQRRKILASESAYPSTPSKQKSKCRLFQYPIEVIITLNTM